MPDGLCPAQRIGPEKHFAVACAWPDNVRDQKRYEHTKPWHFVNIPRSATSVSASDCPKQGCLLSAITEMQQRLQNKPDTDGQALLFLGHFIADLHQPMHVSYFDDLIFRHIKDFGGGVAVNIAAFSKGG